MVTCDKDLASPKSQIFTKHSPSNRTFDGCTTIRQVTVTFAVSRNKIHYFRQSQLDSIKDTNAGILITRLANLFHNIVVVAILCVPPPSTILCCILGPLTTLYWGHFSCLQKFILQTAASQTTEVGSFHHWPVTFVCNHVSTKQSRILITTEVSKLTLTCKLSFLSHQWHQIPSFEGTTWFPNTSSS